MILIGIISAYKTVSYTSIKVVAGLVQIKLQLKQVNLTEKIKCDNKRGKIMEKQTKLKMKKIKKKII